MYLLYVKLILLGCYFKQHQSDMEYNAQPLKLYKFGEISHLLHNQCMREADL